MTTLKVSLSKEEIGELAELAESFGITKQKALKQLAFNCKEFKNFKQKDYNLLYAELLSINKNVSELLNFLKQEDNAEAIEAIFVLHEIKDKIEELQQKI